MFDKHKLENAISEYKKRFVKTIQRTIRTDAKPYKNIKSGLIELENSIGFQTRIQSSYLNLRQYSIPVYQRNYE